MGKNCHEIHPPHSPLRRRSFPADLIRRVAVPHGLSSGIRFLHQGAAEGCEPGREGLNKIPRKQNIYFEDWNSNLYFVAHERY